MKSLRLVGAVGVCVLTLTGCSTNGVAHPTSVTQDTTSKETIPRPQTLQNPLVDQLPNAVKQSLEVTLNKVSFHFTLPSYHPFTSRQVDSAGKGSSPNSTAYTFFMVDFFSPIRNNEQQDINVQESYLQKNPFNSANGEKVVLNHDVTAYFDAHGPNGTTLSWYERHVAYDLSAAKIDVKSRTSTGELSKGMLVKIANSFEGS
ncbi:hypothetical protein [Alicyclobacillus sp. SP_1]|uniref:hypothetical protein n=1 Tax=Alicyclobacillus sp. SP_1 TaxID=2942475 RepID=UPI0021587482|nr:hypothetical protein [Alicyclobacillus sp. SP_1]